MVVQPERIEKEKVGDVETNPVLAPFYHQNQENKKNLDQSTNKLWLIVRYMGGTSTEPQSEQIDHEKENSFELRGGE